MLGAVGGARLGISFFEREMERRRGDPVEIALGESIGCSSWYMVFAVEDICRRCCENSRLGIGDTGFGMTIWSTWAICFGGSGSALLGAVPINNDNISCSSNGEEVIVEGLGTVATLCLFSCSNGLTRSGTSGLGLSLILFPSESVLSPSVVVTDGVSMLVYELLTGNARAIPS